MNAKEIIVKATDGLVGSAVNGVLWWLYWYGASFGKTKTSYGAYLAFREADEALKDFNYESFKQILSILRRRQLIRKKKTYSGMELEITSAGKKRIRSEFPIYEVKRPWDGYLYLVSYDVPEPKHILRDLLRRHLKTIGCALLQESLWLTPYNPRKLLDEFIEEHGIQGTILVSKLGKDGAVGEEGLTQLLERVYGLKTLNDRYRDFLDQWSSSKKPALWSLRVAYERILHDDSQLPFTLLPEDWLGDKAYHLYNKLCINRVSAETQS